jgi:hypothetical protein
VDADQQVILTATQDLKYRLRYTLPREVWPKDDTFVLSADIDDLQEEIKRSRKDDNAWPRIHYLWQHNPVLEWIQTYTSKSLLSLGLKDFRLPDDSLNRWR